MTDGLEADRDYFRLVRLTVERIELFWHYYSPLSAAPALIHQFSPCSRGVAIESTAARAFSAKARSAVIVTVSTVRTNSAIMRAASGVGALSSAASSLEHSISSSIAAISSKLSAASSRP